MTTLDADDDVITEPPTAPPRLRCSRRLSPSEGPITENECLLRQARCKDAEGETCGVGCTARVAGYSHALRSEIRARVEAVRDAVLTCVQGAGRTGATKLEIMGVTGLADTTVYNMLTRLIHEGHVSARNGVRQPNAGRAQLVYFIR